MLSESVNNAEYFCVVLMLIVWWLKRCKGAQEAGEIYRKVGWVKIPTTREQFLALETKITTANKQQHIITNNKITTTTTTTTTTCRIHLCGTILLPRRALHHIHPANTNPDQVENVKT